MANAGMITFRGAVDHSSEFRRHVVVRMETVAVGRYDEDVVGVDAGTRGIHHFIVIAAQVAGEPEARFADLDFKAARAEDVSGGMVLEVESSQRVRLAEDHRLQESQSFGSILGRKQRQRLGVFGEPLQRGVSRVFLLQMPAIRQEKAQQFRCRWRAIDGAVESLFVQPRQVARVVNVRVSKDDLVNLCWRKREWLPIARPEVLQTLKQTAVDQRRAARSVQQILRACYASSGSEELNGNGVIHVLKQLRCFCASSQRVLQVAAPHLPETRECAGPEPVRRIQPSAQRLLVRPTGACQS